MLYKRSNNIKLKNCLVPENNNEPYLQYSIRESSIFFLKDLVNEFFINNKELAVKDIENQGWYFNEYKLDPTIISMINAMRIIEKSLIRIEEHIDNFANFIIERVQILYYDVNDKKHGEERFVIINTTGQNLSVTENVKPILLGKITENSKSTEWEERETWFWKNRDKKNEQTADNGVNDFLIWCFQIIDKQDEIDLIKKSKEVFKREIFRIENILDKIHLYFNAMKSLLILLTKEDSNIQIQFKYINQNNKVRSIVELRNLTKERKQNILLPLLEFMVNVSKEECQVYQFVRRLRKNYFDLHWKERNNNYVDWRYVLQLINNSNDLNQILFSSSLNNGFINIPKVNLYEWFNYEEQIKAKLNIKYQNIIEEMEDHSDFMGDLSFLFSLYDNDINDNDKLINDVQFYFKNYCNLIDLLKIDKANLNPVLSNYFRLFRLFIGCNKVGHIYKTSGAFPGVLFSTLNREHLKIEEFKNLCKSDNLLEHIIQFLKNIVINQDILDVNEDNYNVEKFIKCWLTLKVFYASKMNVLISLYDGNETGVAAYLDKDRNKLFTNIPFSIEISICGFGVKSGFGEGNYVHYTSPEFWLNPSAIDTPFGGIQMKIQKEESEYELEENKKIINDIKHFIFNIN